MILLIIVLPIFNPIGKLNVVLFTPEPANYHDSEVPEEAKTLAHVSEQNFTTIFGMEMLRGLSASFLIVWIIFQYRTFFHLFILLYQISYFLHHLTSHSRSLLQLGNVNTYYLLQAVQSYSVTFSVSLWQYHTHGKKVHSVQGLEESMLYDAILMERYCLSFNLHYSLDELRVFAYLKLSAL